MSLGISFTRFSISLSSYHFGVRFIKRLKITSKLKNTFSKVQLHLCYTVKKVQYIGTYEVFVKNKRRKENCMKRKGIVCAGLWLAVLGSSNVWADVFPYEIEVENRENNEEYLYMTMADVEIASESFLALEETVNAWAKERTENREALKIQYMEMAEAEKEANGDEFYGYSISEMLTITRSDERILSLREESYQYLGGAYPVSFIGGVNFDVQTGALLELEDLFVDPEGFKDASAQFIVGYVENVYDLSVTEEQVLALWDTEMEWYMDASGMTVIFNEDTLGPHALGILEIPLTMANVQDYMKAEYEEFVGAGVYSLQANVPILVSVGEEETTLLINEEEGQYEWDYSVSDGKTTLEVGQFGYLHSAYYMQKDDGGAYLLMDVDMASDDYSTFVFKVSEEEIVQTDVLDAAIDTGHISPKKMDMQKWINVLGTYGAEKTYTLDESGMFVTEETEYRLCGTLENRVEIISVVDLPFYINGKATVMPAGMGFRMISTDEETYAVMQVTETGQVGELPFARGEGDDYWNLYIGEKKVDDCFEMLPYAG